MRKFNLEHYNSLKLLCKRGHPLLNENRIMFNGWDTHGRGCRACDNASRSARRCNITDPEMRESFIREDSRKRIERMLWEIALTNRVKWQNTRGKVSK
jgi:hypothetical protein